MPRERRRRAAGAVLAGITAALLLNPGTAWADNMLATADPVPGAVLIEAPGAVTLAFPGIVAPELSHIAVSTASGEDLTDGTADLPDPRTLRQPISVPPAGDVTVAYHVTFADGSSETAAYRFSAGTGVAPAPLDATARRIATAEVAEHAHSIDGISAVLLVVDGAVLAGVLLLLFARPRSRDGRSAPETSWRYRG